MADAIVLFKAVSGHDTSIIKQLKLIPETKNAFGTLGKYDVIARFSSNVERLDDILLRDVKQINNLVGILTLRLAGKESLLGKKLSLEENEILDKYAVQAYVTIRTKNRKNEDMLRTLGEIPEIVEGDLVTGLFDIIVRIVAPTYNDLSDVVTNKIRRFEDIYSTITLPTV